jgi:hypothetical protein
MKKGSGINDNIMLTEVEEFALGFRSNEVKVFAFGLGPKAIFSFNNETSIEEDK